MVGVKQLAGQALWYGISNIAARVLNYLLTPILTYLMAEVIDRQMLASLIPSHFDAQSTVGIYSANYKLAIFITLFIQAFKMAAEPFFFNQSTDRNAPALYARVMKWFVITLALAFLSSALYLDIWKYMVSASYRSGLGIVPILLGANICVGIYYNLSIWYKLTDRLRVGLYISLLGTAITLIGSYFLIAYYGMYAAAWTTFVCYATMMSVTDFMGQRHYYIPYPVKRIAVYLAVMLICFAIKSCINSVSSPWSTTLQLVLRLPAAIVLTVLYLLLILKLEHNELINVRFIAKWLKPLLNNR